MASRPPCFRQVTRSGRFIFRKAPKPPSCCTISLIGYFDGEERFLERVPFGRLRVGGERSCRRTWGGAAMSVEAKAEPIVLSILVPVRNEGLNVAGAGLLCISTTASDMIHWLVFARILSPVRHRRLPMQINMFKLHAGQGASLCSSRQLATSEPPCVCRLGG